MLAAITLVAIIVVALWKPATSPRNEQGEVTTEPSTFDAQLQWNATQSELDSTAADVERLEAAAQGDVEK
jgi:type II secretory pathway component PulM